MRRAEEQCVKNEEVTPDVMTEMIGVRLGVSGGWIPARFFR